MCKCTYRKFENHLTSWAVLFLLNLMSGKYILSTAELGYRTQKNISFALRRCIGVNVDEFTEVKESICCFLINCLIFFGLSFLSLFLKVVLWVVFFLFTHTRTIKICFRIVFIIITWFSIYWILDRLIDSEWEQWSVIECDR